ncbi:ankyrin repeat domain-containing protein 60-like isoform X2 [Pristis pectinata]|nr:ankyrin repeat domain-containing protein 60-like isoform X2 [Pristis pectinata]
MPDNVTLKFNGVISGGIIRMKTWHQDGWQNLLRAAALGNNQELLSLGVTKHSNYSTPNSRRMNAEEKTDWLAERNFIALLLASHRGHTDMVRFLLMNGSNLNTRTRDGHSALHMAVVGAKGQCLSYLLQQGADIEGTDRQGRTVLDLARMTGHKENIGKVLQFQWLKRTAGLKPAGPIGRSDLFAHQKFDSTLKTWQAGTHRKLYMANLLKSWGPRGPLADRRPPIPGTVGARGPRNPRRAQPAAPSPGRQLAPRQSHQLPPATNTRRSLAVPSRAAHPRAGRSGDREPWRARQG